MAYNGIQDRARASAAQVTVRQAAGKAAAYRAEHEICPADLGTINVTNSSNTTYQYSCDTSATPAAYCVTATVNNHTYYLDSAVQTKPTTGKCSTYNYLLSDDTSDTKPVPSGVLDSSVYRSGTSSIRLAPGENGRTVRDAPYTGNIGQVYVLSVWIRTDSNWNGTDGNSKIRFGAAAGGAILKACGYSGVRTTWTQVSCDFTLTSANPSISISVGNDGTVGNIWLDDFTLTRSY